MSIAHAKNLIKHSFANHAVQEEIQCTNEKIVYLWDQFLIYEKNGQYEICDQLSEQIKEFTKNMDLLESVKFINKPFTQRDWMCIMSHLNTFAKWEIDFIMSIADPTTKKILENILTHF